MGTKLWKRENNFFWVTYDGWKIHLPCIAGTSAASNDLYMATPNNYSRTFNCLKVQREDLYCYKIASIENLMTQYAWTCIVVCALTRRHCHEGCFAGIQSSAEHIQGVGISVYSAKRFNLWKIHGENDSMRKNTLGRLLLPQGKPYEAKPSRYVTPSLPVLIAGAAVSPSQRAVLSLSAQNMMRSS